MKAMFFRNIPNYDTLIANTLRHCGVVAECCSIKSIALNNSDFKSFCGNFKKSYDFLMPFIDTAIRINGVWRCVSVTSEERELLVVMEHYQYPRYLAIALKE